ncbi:alkaline phosphatase family protein [Bradyrhizobium sp. Pear76]|uniref:alkaline phosphatase family protein n=1 Tax=Bradyrhizobium oropedii TaxID=1571201 RepID=UPI001E414FB6|nr:nucleotide pyrophosphatase/phosphodiesterase family protein [Bradyrhizobium oropedii]MCC8965370.1 alkaline phosphatase family protein [Bradyrhizobium oropedii]
MTVNKTEQARFVVVSFDGLRPDLIDSALTPNIVRLKERGVTLACHRTVYPSETRVAFPSLITGATPDQHGMIGNKYVDRTAMPTRYIDTSDAKRLRELDLESGGRLMSAPTLGEILAKRGRSLAVLATNTPGTTRLFHHKAEDFGHMRLSGHFPEACTPDTLKLEIEDRFGTLPPAPPPGTPDLEAQELITSAFLEVVWPKSKPDVTILSFGEPDTCSHFSGTGAEKTREVIAFCDKQLGRVIDWWEAEAHNNDVQIAVISDHGHITGHTRVSVADSLRRAGFSPSTAPGVDVDAVVVPGQVGAIYLPDRTDRNVIKAVEAITSEPWCGCVFTAPKNEVEGIAPGTFGRHLVGVEHARSPDIVFSFRTDDSVDPFGLVGGTYYDNDRRTGLGLHGGLHPKELAAVGVLAGTAFLDSGLMSRTPSGICDVVPTILEVMDIERSQGMTGRVLQEALANTSAAADSSITPDIFETGSGAYSQALRRVRVGTSIYLDGGWVGSGAPTAARRHA